MDVGAWLRRLGWSGTSRRSATTTSTPRSCRLTAEDLKDLGVASVGHRRKLLEAHRRAAERHAAVAAVVPGRCRTAATQTPAAGSPEAERRQLTVMFFDLVGSTALSARLDPEDMREVIRRLPGRCRRRGRAASRARRQVHGRRRARLLRLPAAHEDDAERAVRAGLGARRGGRAAAHAGGERARGPGRHRDRPGRGRRPDRRGRGAGAGGGRRDAEPRGPAAGARRAGQRW